MIDHYPVGPQPIGNACIALSEFGGEIGDPVGAALRVDGWRRVSVLRPRSVADAGAAAIATYQDAVRELALTYQFKSGNRRGAVDIVWNLRQVEGSRGSMRSRVKRWTE